MSYLGISDLRIVYERDKPPVLNHYNLAIEEGELVSLLGPSGCGKTTTLRAVAGFVEPAEGQIIIDGRDNTRLPPNKRDIGLVFQSYALFPHLSVFNNIAFGLQMRNIGREEIKERVRKALQMVDLTEFTERRPAQLSGGQRQRVALARAIVIEPKLLLLDEPLSNLDAKLRVSMRTEIRRLQQRLGITTLYVTHDQVEALAISDRVVVMNHGKIEQIGSPETIYNTPKTAFVADFMGFSNQFEVHLTSAEKDALHVSVMEHQFVVKTEAEHIEVGSAYQLYFRPEAARLLHEEEENCIPGTVLFFTFQGSTVEYIIETELGEFLVHEKSESERFSPGSVFIKIDQENLIAIKK